MELWLIKLIAAGILFVLSFTFGLSPLFCLRRYIVNPNAGKAKAALGFASCLAAGVFLAVCLLDLLPDVQESLTAGLSELNMKVSFPLAELIMAIGLFFILAVELSVSMCSPDLTEMMHSHGGHGHAHSADHGPGHHHNHRAEYEDISGDDSVENDRHSHGHSHSSSQPPATAAQPHVHHHSTHRHHILRRHHSSECEREIAVSSPAAVALLAGSSETSALLTRSPSVQSLPPIHLESRTLREVTADAGLTVFDRPFRAIILLVALSIHSLFEGLSIGAAQNEDVVLQLTLALAIHKPLESLGVCLSLIKSAKTQSFVVKMVILFSVTCPLGVGIGIGVLGFLSSGVSDLVTGILQGLAGGSFLYVVFIEVLPHEFVDVLENPQGQGHHGGHDEESGGRGIRPLTPSSAAKEVKRIRTLKMFKLLGLLLGFTLITLTKLFLPEGDEGYIHPC